MGCFPHEVLMRGNSAQIQELFIFMELEPFGPQAMNLNFGLITSMLANIFKKKGAKTMRPEEMSLGDFSKGKDKKKMSSKVMSGVLKNIVKTFGGEVIDKVERAKRVAQRLARGKE